MFDRILKTPLRDIFVLLGLTETPQVSQLHYSELENLSFIFVCENLTKRNFKVRSDQSSVTL